MFLKRLLDSIGLKWRLILGVSALLLTSSVLLSIFLIGEFSDSAIEGLQQRGTSLAKNLAYNAEFGVMLELSPELDAFVDGILSEKDILFARVYTKDGTLLCERIREGFNKKELYANDSAHSAAEENELTTSGREAVCDNYSLRDGTRFIEIVSPVKTMKSDISKEERGSATASLDKTGKKSVVIGYVHVGISLEQTERKVKETAKMIVFFTLLLVMLGILLSVTLVKMIASPINTLVEATERIASGDLTQRVRIDTDEELARLAASFNTMSDSLAKSQRELELHNQNLEEKIRERTQKLEEVQRQVVQSEKMAAVGQLAAGVAHELNNPLGGILGYAQFAQEKIAAGTVDENDVPIFRRYLADIEQQARRCKMIVKNLLKFSRSTDKSEFDLVDINAALEETFVFTSHQLGMKDIKLTRMLQPNMPKVFGNTNLLQQVFTNILINSMQSMPDGGELHVTTSVSAPVGEFGGSVEISFSDTGSGIPEEIRNKIFEPFFTTKKVGEGTGLGLSVSYGIVKDHGGDIKIQSKVGIGSTFTVILPIVKENAGVTA